MPAVPSAVDVTLVSLTAMAMAVMTVMVSRAQLLHLQTKLAAEAAEVQALAAVPQAPLMVRKWEQSQHALLLKKQKSLSAVSQLSLSKSLVALLRHRLVRKSARSRQKHQQ